MTLRRRALLAGALLLAACSGVDQEPAASASAVAGAAPASPATTASTTSAAADSVLLRLRPEAGDRYLMTLDVNQDMTMSMAGMPATEMSNAQVMTASQEIVSVAEDGTVESVQTMERVRLEGKMGETSVMSFDSASEEPLEEEMAEFGAMKEMIGKPITVTFSPRGEVLGFEGLKEIWAAAAGDDPAMQAIMGQLESMFGENAMRQQMQLYGVLFPEEAIEPGHAWSHQMDLSNQLFGTMVFDVSYVFTGREMRDTVDCALLVMKIEGDLDLDMDGLTGMLGASGDLDMDLAMDVTQMSGGGELCVDVANGLTRQADMSLDVGIDISMAMGEQNMDMGITLDQTILLTLDPDGE